MRLALKSCTIRPWRWDDAESLVKHANNRKVWLTLWDLFPHPYTIQDAHEFLQRAINEQPTTKFCIEVNGRAVGGMGIRPGKTSINMLPGWVTGSAKTSGDAAS
jgi:ribosomal-protein-alanine N-acetyltransferase